MRVGRRAIRAELASGLITGTGHFVIHPGRINGLHGHLVLGQRAGFVRADDGRTAQRFDRRQLADDHMTFGHAGDTDSQGDGHCHRQTLGDSRHGQGDRCDEGIDRFLTSQPAGEKGQQRETQDKPHQ